MTDLLRPGADVRVRDVSGEWCEADMVTPGGWTPCRCAERAAELTEKGAEG